MSETLTVRGLTSEQIRSLDPRDLLERLKPLIDSTARRSFVYGYTQEDLVQELSLVAWKCQQSFNPEAASGHGGAKSSFINFVIHAFDNRLGHLDYAGKKQNRALTALECAECGVKRTTFVRRKCSECGCGRWKSVFDGFVLSVDGLMMSERFSWEPADPNSDHDGVDLGSVIDSIAREFSGSVREKVVLGIEDGKLTGGLRKRVQVLISQRPELLGITQ